MAGNETIRGYKITYEKKAPRELSMDYLMQTHEAAALQTQLREAIAENGSPCQTDPERWQPDELPTDKEAQRMCATCPLATFQICDAFRKASSQTYGVYAGKVEGRKLQEAPEKEED